MRGGVILDPLTGRPIPDLERLAPPRIAESLRLARLFRDGPVAMADTKISALSAGGAPQAADQFVVARSGANDKIAGNQLPGFEFDYVQHTSGFTFGAEADFIVGNSVTYDGSTRIKIEVFAAIDITTSAVSTGAILRLYDGTTALNRIVDMRLTNSGSGPAHGVVFLTPTSGAHTYKITGAKAGSGTSVILDEGAVAGGAGVYVPSWYRITKA